MSKKKNSFEKYNHNEECCCNNNNPNISYKIIENYRSILDRKQQLISTWKIFHNNEKVNFTTGTQYRKGTDALVIRLNHICLINPWYKYINVNKHLLSIVKNNQYYKVFEIVLLECSCLTNLNEYELAIIECPCLEQMNIYCSYCRLTLTATEQSNRLFENMKQQINFSFPLDTINDTFHSQSGPYQHQCTVQIQVDSQPILDSITESTKLPQASLISQAVHSDVNNSLSESKIITIESKEDLSLNRNTFEEIIKYQNRETQTKIFAIFLPESPLSEMNPAKTEERTSKNVTCICQVNTLSYLIKTNESQTDLQRMDCSSSTTFLYTEPQLMKKLSIEDKTKMQHHQTITDHKYDGQDVNIPIIQFEEDEQLDSLVEEHSKESTFTSLPLKCINACDTIDIDEPYTSITSFPIDDDIITRSVSLDQRDENSDLPMHTINVNKQNHMINVNNNCEQLTSDRLLSVVYQSSKFFRFISHKRRRYRNKKRIYDFLQRLYRRKKTNTTELGSSKQPSPVSQHHRFEYHLPSTQINTIKYIPSSNCRQQSIINVHLNNSDNTSQYKSIDHTIIVRATKNSIACKQLQSLVNNDDTHLEQLINSQLTLTYNNNFKSVCILIDDHKQSEQYRSTFLHYIYKTLSNTLHKILNEELIQITCMNLAFFNNSLCDIIDMQRLRLIDTGKKILLLPSCEISLKTSNDINKAINRLSTNMSFTHQIFIINFTHKSSSSSSLSGSFFFLQLAPICSLRPTGLLTNLNSTTYSVSNLIRQFNNNQLFNHNIAKRYLLNDCLLNRLLKSYLFSSQQTMTVITVKQRDIKKILI